MAEMIVYKTVEDCAIRLDVYPALSGPGAPVIVWIHGGALITGSRKGVRPVLRDLLAERGYAQVSIDYRLAPETKLPEILEDLRDAFAWVQTAGAEDWGFDVRRVGVIGHSAGGYLALMAGFMVEPRPAALVSFYGYGDISGGWYSRPDAFYCQQPQVRRRDAYAAVGTGPISEAAHEQRGLFYLYCRQNGLWPHKVVGMNPDSDPAAYDPLCPVRNVTPEYPPTLLTHGTADTDVPFQQSVDMARALARANVPHELVTIPGGPHGFDGAVTRDAIEADTRTPAAQAIQESVRFLARHV